MPTWKRRYYLYRVSDELEKQKEAIEKAQRKHQTSTGFSKKRR